MSFVWLVALLQQGVNGINKFREKKAPVLATHFTPPSTSDVPIPTRETSIYVYSPSTRINRNLGIAFLILAVIGFTVMMSLINDTLSGDGAGGMFVGVMGAWICFLQYRFRKRLLYCIGPNGLVSQYPGCETLVARWVDIYQISVERKHLSVELWDRTKYTVVCPKAGRKETANLIQTSLERPKYAKAEQLVRKWTLELDD
jgi:hypothetical protein